MALIPPDAGIRMRLQGETPLPSITPLQGIPSDLPDLLPGQTFSARIQEVLPENTYKALVAGKQLTLQLPEGAKPGDTLELVVIDRTPKLLIAQLNSQTAAAAANPPYPYATLSRSAQLIGNLLLQEGETPQPAALNGGQPLLPQPPARGADLAPRLEQAITQSGLFYEAHQAQWVAGKLPLAQLLQEPQGQHSSPAALSNQNVSPEASVRHGALAAPPEAGRGAANAASAPAATLLQTAPGTGERTETAAAQQQQTAGLPHKVPDELRPLVQQQLDAVATQRLVWHGEAWPNQRIEWEIEREQKRETREDAGEEDSWRTTLRLTTPRLGQVDATMQLTAAGIRVSLATPVDATAADLRDEAPALETALAAAGVPLLSFMVKSESGNE